MTYAVEIVVRKKEGKFYYGYASQYPQNKGFEPINSYGKWYASQMSFKPFRTALKEAKNECIRLNNSSYVSLKAWQSFGNADKDFFMKMCIEIFIEFAVRKL